MDGVAEQVFPVRLCSELRQPEDASNLRPADCLEERPGLAAGTLARGEKALYLMVDGQSEIERGVVLLQVLKDRNPVAARFGAKFLDDRCLADAPLGIDTDRLLIEDVPDLLDNVVATNHFTKVDLTPRICFHVDPSARGHLGV
ncbi:hypothetical protein [Methylotetracoccus oryzae]|uniref:hypothetical protein n=1 Tax=Methylotetracoccus oryzae TaxID=1919059 RepID=UPI0019137056|nr:hypothetical protein [Methylotetracoccus oryzae]